MEDYGKMMMESFKDKVFRVTMTVLLIMIAMIAVIPLLSTIAMSLSSSTAADMNAVTLWPVDFTLASWKHILQDASLWRSCAVTAVSTILTVVLSIFVTALMAYPLSKNYFKAGRVLMIFVILTMIFKAPVVPYFLALKNLGFYNNPIVLVIPHIFSAYNMAIMRTSFKAFPSEIEEAAVIDGHAVHEGLLTKGNRQGHHGHLFADAFRHIRRGIYNNSNFLHVNLRLLSFSGSPAPAAGRWLPALHRARGGLLPSGRRPPDPQWRRRAR